MNHHLSSHLKPLQDDLLANMGTGTPKSSPSKRSTREKSEDRRGSEHSEAENFDSKLSKLPSVNFSDSEESTGK